LRNKLEDLKRKSGIDLWVSPPATGDAPEGIEATGDPNMNLPWTHAGLPTITVPAGKSQRGLPLGLQLTASFMEDEKLVSWTNKLAKSSTATSGSRG
jgi:Asp-tRNA(Asn)/Glu-tRNA(Gln) amidotransferase A subunit family amidase